jgi:hypothetical protein
MNNIPAWKKVSFLILPSLVAFVALTWIGVHFFINRSLSVQIDTSHLKPGQTLVIHTQFRNLWPSFIRDDVPISINDSGGNDRIITLPALLDAAGVTLAELLAPDKTKTEQARAALRTALSSLSGFIDAQYLPVIRGEQRLEQLESNVGCAIGLGPPQGRAPLSTSYREAYYVLPTTPPGEYVVHVPGNRFCAEDIPSLTKSFLVTVLPPTNS